jgi:hypothetical protein
LTTKDLAGNQTLHETRGDSGTAEVPLPGAIDRSGSLNQSAETPVGPMPISTATALLASSLEAGKRTIP